MIRPQRGDYPARAISSALQAMADVLVAGSSIVRPRERLASSMAGTESRRLARHFRCLPFGKTD